MLILQLIKYRCKQKPIVKAMELLKLESQELIKDEDVACLKLIGSIYIEMRSLSC
jgi:hypothetical protein